MGIFRARRKKAKAVMDVPSEQRVKIHWGEHIPTGEIARLNSLLPWASFIVDSQGRVQGAAYSDNKRNTPQVIPDRRIVEFNRRFGLSGKTVLEAGCFEGHHTAALASFGAEVSAFDGRIENVVKTLTRCSLLGYFPKVFFWDLEQQAPDFLASEFAMLHHIGVLYHLSDPIAHLDMILDRISDAVVLDTHVADPEASLQRGRHGSFEYNFWSFRESGREPPFAGLTDYAKWILLDDLEQFLKLKGFKHIDVAEHREERNGLRVLIYAHR